MFSVTSNDIVIVFSVKYYLSTVFIYLPCFLIVFILTRVLAQDSDRAFSNSIVTYWFQPLDGMVSSQFVIEPSTGVIRLLRALDRDEPVHHTAFILPVCIYTDSCIYLN